MKKIFIFSIILIFLLGCSSETRKESGESIRDDTPEEITESSEIEITESELSSETDDFSDGFSEETKETKETSESSLQQNGTNQTKKAGLLTAGEWNDLDNWDFFNKVLNGEFASMTDYWKIYPINRISVNLTDDSNSPVINADIKLLYKNDIVWEAKTDNYGNAELWIDIFANIPNEQKTKIKIENYSIKINNKKKINNVKLFPKVNKIKIDDKSSLSSEAQICFVVDATASMGDELEFLKTELEDIIKRTQLNFSDITIATSSVFYRDSKDDYVTKKSSFTDDIFSTINFIKKQYADGGGDFPEAVHSALNIAVNKMKWDKKAKTRIMFFILDAPPHYKTNILKQLQKDIKKAATLGIKIIPIVASGIDKETEFLFRFMATSTNGTYVFITDDSGIGNSHLEPTIGEYEVELLNELMIRLIEKYLK